MVDEVQAQPESLFTPLPDEAPKSEPAPAPEAAPKPDSSGGIFVPVEQFKDRLSSQYDPEDARKGAISGIYEGVTRIPAAAKHLYGMAQDEAAYLGYRGLEKLGAIKSADDLYADYELGKQQVNQPIQDVKDKISEKWNQELADANDKKRDNQPGIGFARGVFNTIDNLNYDPETRAGALAKETVAGGTELALYRFLGAGNLLSRFGAGALSGGLGEGMRQKFEGTPYEPYAQFAGAFTGQFLGEAGAKAAGSFAKGYKFFGAEKEFELALSSALQEDSKDGLLRMSPQELSAKMKAGEEFNIGDVLKPGSKTAGLLEDMAAHVPGKKGDNLIAQTIMDMAGGRELNAGNIKTALKEAASDEADRVFDIARANPAANNITTKDIGKWINNPKVKSIMDDVADLAGLPTKDQGRILKVPETIPGKPEVLAKTEPTGLLDASGNPIMRVIPGTPAVPEKYVGGNLNFWQKVKERLGDEYARTGETAFLDAKNELVKSLTNKVPEYGDALKATAEKFGNLSAMQDGYALMNNIKSMKIADITNKFKQMTPDQIQAFRDGVLSNIAEVAAQPGGAQKLYNQILEPGSHFSTKLKSTLGEAQYNEIAGSIVQQNITNRAVTLSEKLAKAGEKILENKATVGAAASGIGLVTNYLMGGDTNVNAALGGVGLLLGGRQLALNTLEKKIAPIAMETIRSPEGGARLAKLLQESPEARTFVQKLNAALMRAAIAGGRSVGLNGQESEAPLQSYGLPQPHAHGGRAGYKAGGRVKSAKAAAMALLREIDQTRKMIGKKTEDILSLPDDAVATALTIARGNV